MAQAIPTSFLFGPGKVALAIVPIVIGFLFVSWARRNFPRGMGGHLTCLHGNFRNYFFFGDGKLNGKGIRANQFTLEIDSLPKYGGSTQAIFSVNENYLGRRVDRTDFIQK